jgi:hypothetical protein
MHGMINSSESPMDVKITYQGIQTLICIFAFHFYENYKSVHLDLGPKVLEFAQATLTICRIILDYWSSTSFFDFI